MPKLKTSSTIRKRFKLKKKKNASGKKEVVFEQVQAGGAHFNAKETGKITRNRRGLRGVHKANHKNIKSMLPNG